MCVEIFDNNQARQLKELLKNCGCIRFSDGYWYKFTKKGVTKERAIEKFCAAGGIWTQEITACGEACVNCRKKATGICRGCIEADDFFWTFEQAVSYYQFTMINYMGFQDKGMLLAGGCGDTNRKPQIDKTTHLQEAYLFGKNIYKE